MLGAMGFVWFIIMAVIMIIPFWKIFQKAGFNPALSLLMLIPIINIIAIFYLAFAAWPVHGKGQPPQPPQG
jgi:hypothetical protein